MRQMWLLIEACFLMKYKIRLMCLHLCVFARFIGIAGRRRTLNHVWNPIHIYSVTKFWGTFFFFFFFAALQNANKNTQCEQTLTCGYTFAYSPPQTHAHTYLCLLSHSDHYFLICILSIDHIELIGTLHPLGVLVSKT